MIRVELGEERDGPGLKAGRRHSKWHWRVEGLPLEGYSRQPLLDACRKIKRMGASGGELVGLFRRGGNGPDLACSVSWGAAHTVDETETRFRKWKPYPEV